MDELINYVFNSKMYDLKTLSSTNNASVLRAPALVKVCHFLSLYSLL